MPYPQDTASTGSCMGFVWAMTSQTSGVTLVSKYQINPVSNGLLLERVNKLTPVMSRCRSVEKQDLHIKTLKLATTGLQLEFFIVYNWFMADFLVLFYYWIFLVYNWLVTDLTDLTGLS